MNSSYKNKDLDYGDLIKAITMSINPKKIIEIGILDGYSLTHFVNSTNERTIIKAYDIFDEFNGNHANESEFISLKISSSFQPKNRFFFNTLEKTKQTNIVEIFFLWLNPLISTKTGSFKPLNFLSFLVVKKLI